MAEREQDLVGRLLAQMDRLFDEFHNRVLRRIILAARFAAFGFILLVMALIIVVVFTIAVVRFFNVYVDHHHIWITYLSVGGVLDLAGLIIWRFRRPAKVRS